MIGIIFALCTAIVHALSAVLIRRRIDESDSLSVALITSIIGNAILWPIVFLFVDLQSVNFYGVIFFALAGALAPGVSRLLLFESMETIGVSVSRTLFSIYPIYSVTLGFLLFGEILNVENVIGVFFVLAGVVLIERSCTNSNNVRRKNFSKKDLLIPIIASLAVAFSQIVTKYGLNIYNEQLLGVAIGYSVALIFYLVINSLLTKRIFSVSKTDFKLFWIAGAFLALAWILAFYALSFEKVSIVTPLMQTQPLFILLFAYIYLRKREPLSLGLIASSILVVIGVILVVL